MSNAYNQTTSLFQDSDNATTESQATKAVLEALIDRFGAAVVLGAFAEALDDKAEFGSNSTAAEQRKAKAFKAAGVAVLKVALSQALEVR